MRSLPSWGELGLPESACALPCHDDGAACVLDGREAAIGFPRRWRAVNVFRRRAAAHPLDELATVRTELAAARTEAAVSAEQLLSLREEAEELGVRALVSENSDDVREARHAHGHADRLARELERVRERIRTLEGREQALIATLLGEDPPR